MRLNEIDEWERGGGRGGGEGEGGGSVRMTLSKENEKPT